MQKDIEVILKENERRNKVNNAPFNPITGRGSVGDRVELRLPDFPLTLQFIPCEMVKIPFVAKLIQSGSAARLLEKQLKCEPSQENIAEVVNAFVRMRIRHDFPFWAALYIYIQSKEPGEGEILFRISRPQRRLVDKLESMRLANKPIRLVLLKARQWGGSTVIQLYMMWLQTVHKIGLNSAIVSQTKKTSFAIKAMYDRALKQYPVELLYPLGAAYDANEPKMVNVGLSGDYKKVPQRDCTITIASYEAPDALRGDAYSLVHCSEVGLWNPTDKKSPASVVRSACSGVLYRPYTMIVYESTANGTGNFFHTEYKSAKAGISQFDSLFVPWFDIDLYSSPIAPEDMERFVTELWENRNNPDTPNKRQDSGQYLWWLWQQGATLEGINWYIQERRGKDSHEVMASEYPTDDIEAFVHSGANVFDKYRVEALKATCRPPAYIGDVFGDAAEGAAALTNLKFAEDKQGLLYVWALPEIDPEELVTDRYLTVVDIGGRSAKADWSVIVVFDRMYMIDGGKPSVVAQWRGHADHDILTWKAAQIAKFYDTSLLVIESNTLETKDRERLLDGDQSLFILNQLGNCYPNLYMRQKPQDNIIEGTPVKYGFHTNTATKPMIISSLIKAVREGAYVERDERCLNEYNTYEQKQNGSYGAAKGEHDDILMTRAIGLHICFNEMPLPAIYPKANKRPKPSIISAASI